jgi:DNA polymerase-3 subunit delta'
MADASEHAQGVARALSFDAIAASEALKAQLAPSVEGNPAPVILVGEEGAGKAFVADRLAAALLCDDPDPVTGACGACPSCRLMAHGDHVDLVRLMPDAGKTSIPVARVREDVAGTLHIFPQLSRRRVYIVSAVDVDTLNEQGQNALLKPLEEHPPFVRFILMTEDAERLLPTIRSRSRIVRLGRRDDRDIETIVRAGDPVDAATIDLAVRYGDGLPGQALAIAADPTFRDLRQATLNLLRRCPEADRTFPMTEGLQWFRTEKARIRVVLRLLETYVRDMVLLQLEGTSAKLMNGDVADVLEAMVRRRPAPDVAGAARIIRQTGRALAMHANYDHTIARMLMGLRAFLSGETVPDGVYVTTDDPAL